MARILCIDDEPNRFRGLIALGHQVFLAHGFDQIDVMLSGTHARGDRFDLICCDHDMPLMDGAEVCKEFLCERGIPVVIHSLNPWGADRMSHFLEGHIVPWVIMPCTENGWALKVTELANAPTAAGKWIPPEDV